MGDPRCWDDDAVPLQAGPSPTSGNIKHQMDPQHDGALDERRERSQLGYGLRTNPCLNHEELDLTIVELSTVGPSSNGQREEGDSSSSLGETATVFVTEWSFADHKEAQTTKSP